MSPSVRFAPALALGAAALLAWAGCGPVANPVDAPSATSRPVFTAVVSPARQLRTQPLPGTVVPVAHATVSAQVGGAVLHADLAVGRAVAAGELLVSLDPAPPAARVAQARAAHRHAAREFEREQGLAERGASTAETVRALDERRAIAAAALAEAEALLALSQIRAPFAGVITRDFVKVGDVAALGRALFSLQSPESLEVHVAVPASLPAVALDRDVPVQPGANPSAAPLLAAVGEISPAADPASRSRLVKLRLPPATALTPGTFVRVLWPAGESTVLVVPAAAVSALGQTERVFVVHDGRVRLRLVRTAHAHDPSQRVILAGLAAGEQVVLGPAAALRDGQPVEVRP